ncbi:lipocalin family protein [Rubrolithibacter danxiaensis]|uniref:lipocalin family protein n=1 Tax=Rubrolithibacter danxiaensis TaxID=3390805 RepID=UPI003BF795B0
MRINKWYLLAAAVTVGTIGLTCSSGPSIPAGATAVSPFNVEKYLGRWYEIARFDYRFERNLNNVTADYSLNPDGTIRVLNRGFDYVKNKWKESTGKAKFVNDSNTGRLKVSFFGPFYSGYNVIALDPKYRYALIAGDNLDYLWILSRETTIPDNVREEYIQKAESIGYDTKKLIWVKHDKK